jgi:cyclopropane fatty-acyl-phospholipid synthase-like methyltransferase
VWLAQQGLSVLSVDGSSVAQAKAARLAEARGVSLELQQVDLADWDWPQGRFDLVAAIFIQFAGPELRTQIFENMKRALKPGGLILLEGYRPEQIAYGTGGPRTPENLYTKAMLQEAFSDFEILELAAYDAAIEEGAGHSGTSALIDLVARKPA